MATLVPGANQTATVPIRVIPSSLSSGIKVFLTSDAAGANIKAQSSIVPFVSTGSQQSVAAPLVAPGAGTYYVFVAVYINGISVGVWAKDTVVVVATVANLYGVVVNATTGYPLQGVRVEIAGVFINTDSSGKYGFTGLTPGSYTIIFSKVGYTTLTR